MKIPLLVLVLMAGCTAAKSMNFSPNMESVKHDELVTIPCFACKLTVSLVEKLVSVSLNFTSEDAVSNVLKTKCKELLQLDGLICELLGKAVGSLVWRLENESPEKYCQMLDWCPSDVGAKNGVFNGKLISVSSPMRQRSLHPKCLLCEAAVFAAEKSILSKAKSEIEMVKLLTAVCSKITKHSKKCPEIGAYIGHELWKLKTFSPRKACEKMKMCSSSDKQELSGAALVDEASQMMQTELCYVEDMPAKCLYCEAAVFAAEQLILSTAKTEKDMIKLVTEFCKNVTNNATQCPALGADIGHELWIAKEFPPRKACGMLKMCPSTGGDMGISDLLTLEGNITCTICKDLITIVKFVVVASEKSIENLIVKDICDKMPPATAKACEKAIINDLPVLIQKFIDPDQICTLIKLC